MLGDDLIEFIRENENLSSDFIKTRINQVNVANSFVKINIFYDSMSYELSTESPKMNIVSLLASIGGNLGLFLGVSVFSLFELVEVAIEIYFVSRTNSFNFDS